MNMSRIRSTNSKPEEIVRKYLFSKGFRYRKNVKKLPGCPDIVLSKYKTVIFVNGCFWHKHDCPRFVWPSSNQEYWKPKILRNVERDKNNCRELSSMGWNVITIQDQLRSVENGDIAFEYTIPRMGHRIDVVCIIRGLIFLLEFKVGDSEYRKSTADQVRYMQSIVPDPELRIVHEYTEGYYNGYQNGKEQALEDIASFYG